MMSGPEALGSQTGENSAVNTGQFVDEEKFTTELKKYYSGHNQNSKKSEWTEEKIKNVIIMIEDFNKAKVLGCRPTDKQYYHAKKYDVMTFSDEKVLKRKSQQDPVVQIIPSSQYYQRILDTHVATGHGRRDKIIYALKDKYVVPVFAINIFLQLCKTCLSKKSFPKTGIVVKPLVSDDFNRRGQVDLVDFQSSPDGEYKWMLQYQDHLTKFGFLRPLKTKEAKEVAIEILKIFLEVGSPNILQSDNEREFTASVLKEIVSLWPACKIVNGRPRYPQSQGSVERSNQDVKNMIRAWMVDNNSSNWSIGCYFAQFQKNSSYHSTIARTPFKALFGDDPRCGLASTHLSKNIISQFEMEEDLETFLKMTNNNDDMTVNYNENITADLENPCENDVISAESIVETEGMAETERVGDIWHEFDMISHGTEVPKTDSDLDKLFCHICKKESSGAHTCIKCKRNTHVICGESAENNDEGYGTHLICNLCANEIKILRERKDSHLNLKRAAEKLTAHSSKKFKNIGVGVVLVEVPKVDRGPLDSKNVVGKVIEKRNELYKVGTSFGVINDWLPRNAVLPTPGEILTDDLSEAKLPLRKISTMSSSFGGQGMKHCNCKKYSKGQCLSNKCNFEDENWEDYPPPKILSNWSNIHTMIAQVVAIIPMVSDLLMQTVVEQFPYYKAGCYVNRAYILNLIWMSKYIPLLQEQIITTIISRMVIMDVNIIDNSKKKKQSDMIFEMDMDEQDIVAETLDYCMMEMLKWLEEERDPALNILCNVFERVVLPTHGIRHVQFLLLYTISISQTCADRVLNNLWMVAAGRHGLGPGALATRRTAASHLAGLLARCVRVPNSRLMHYLRNMAEWCHSYITATQESYTASDNTKVNGAFLAICHAIFYLVAFKNHHLFMNKENLHFVESLNLPRLVTCSLNPLRTCPPQVTHAFSSVTRSHQVAYCQAIIEKNARHTLQASTTKQYDEWFPYDPYTLPKSGKVIWPLCIEYKDFLKDGDSESQYSSMKRKLDEDDDYLMLVSPSQKLANSLSNCISPGFRTSESIHM